MAALNKMSNSKNAYVERTFCSNSLEVIGTVTLISEITGYEVELKTLDDREPNKVIVELTVTSQSPFGEEKKVVTVYEGLYACIHKMCVGNPELGLLGSTPEEGRRIEEWVNRCVSHTPEELTPLVERTLSPNSTYLIGSSTPTIADICVAVFLYSHFLVNPNKVLQPWMDVLLLRHSNFLDVLHPLLQQQQNQKDEGVEQPPSFVPSLEGYSALSPEECSAHDILVALSQASIPYYAYPHMKCNTAEELVSNVPLPSSDHVHTKNLLFKDKKHGLFLVTTTASTSASASDITKSLSKLVQGKSNFRLASSDTLKETLGVEPGCVGPLSLWKDTSSAVTFVLDETLLSNSYSYIHSHPLVNTVSCMLRPQDLLQFITQVTKHEPLVTSLLIDTTSSHDISKKGDTAADKPKKKVSSSQPSNTTTTTAKAAAAKGETLLALQWKKNENFPNWYSDVIILSEMISYYNVSGCYILRPWSYKIWEIIQNWFNEKIQEYGVENSYFPMFVSKDRLEREKDHVEGFAPEVAWVTKSGDTDLAVPIAIRPTSETIMYPAFADWIQSHRDLPLKLNQWSNVVRWEFKWPTPFLRTREFLWQEGHTAHSTHEEAQEMVLQALEWYRGVYEDLLAIPVVKGYKTEKEKFAGGHRTTTVEAYIPGSGRSIQGATSHDLGQNFGKMFDITFQNASGTSEVAWQTSWGLTTRTIGVMVMMHGDDQGLVLPPRVAPLQCVIVPIVSKSCPLETITPYCLSVMMQLKHAGIRIKYDDRTIYNPGWKYNHWEQKGVPIRIEIGPRDMERNQVRLVVRRNGEKMDVPVDDTFAPFVVEKLTVIHKEMFDAAQESRDAHLVKVMEWKDFVPNLEKNNMVLTPWIGGEHEEWEEWVKEKSREESLAARGEAAEDARTATSVAAKTLCIPFDQPELPPGTKCIASGEDATCWILWGRSY